MNYIEKLIQCPFFIGEDGFRVKCEGSEEDSKLFLIFQNKKLKSRHEDKYCCKQWESCRIAKMLNQKWEDKDAKVWK